MTYYTMSEMERRLLVKNMREIANEIEEGLHKPSRSFMNVIVCEKSELLSRETRHMTMGELDPRVAQARGDCMSKSGITILGEET